MGGRTRASGGGFGLARSAYCLHAVGSQACLASLSNGGYYGPFVESEGW
jgi:hypothetical protein